jgi:uncharacterized protein
MRLDDLDPSSNVSDQGTGSGGFGGFGGGGGGGGLLSLLFTFLPMLLGRRIGCWGIAIIAVVGYFLMSGGGLNLGSSGVAPSQPSAQSSGQGDVACDTPDELFACRVLKSTENTWGAAISGYVPAKLVFYSNSGNSGCGAAQSAMGPFYCPTDQSVYLDTEFFGKMGREMGAKGDFAKAYVIAHEVGHHLQTIGGIADKVRRAQSRASQAQGNALQVRMELQADCFAGVWAAKNAQQLQISGQDIQDGMTAANAIGDDTLMRNAGQRPVESMFTHGTSEQRMAALRRGLQTGDLASCDTFQGVL